MCVSPYRSMFIRKIATQRVGNLGSPQSTVFATEWETNNLTDISIHVSGCLVLLKHINRTQRSCCSTLCSTRNQGWFANWLSNRIWWKRGWLKHKFIHPYLQEGKSTSFNINISSLNHRLPSTHASLCYNIQDILTK